MSVDQTPEAPPGHKPTVVSVSSEYPAYIVECECGVATDVHAERRNVMGYWADHVANLTP